MKNRLIIIIGAGTLVTLGALGPASLAQTADAALSRTAGKLMRVAAVQMKPEIVNYRLQPADVFEEVEKTLTRLETLVRKAANGKCDALVFPEDTLGLLHWSGMNADNAKEVLRESVQRMLERLGRAAARHAVYLIVCSDNVEADGAVYNTAFFLGRDGKELGRYHKVCPTWSESATRKRGTAFPVFSTPDLGTVGMLICYDMVMPETARCLALQGADIIFFPTMGGAAIGDGDIGVQALRVRAVENFVYVVVAQRGGGAMIISPQGTILARAGDKEEMAIADIDPFSGREGGDAVNQQRDMRARLFRERNPAAFGILAETNPPVLAKVPIEIGTADAGRISARVLTIGEEEFNRATAAAAAGKTEEAILAFEKLRADYRGSWIDRVAQERLKTLRK